MKTYVLKLELQSPTLAGSGTGFGAEINTDIVFDDIGIPFIPAKRIKGCLLDAAKEAVDDIFSLAKIKSADFDINTTFGKTGDEKSAPVYFSNLFIENHAQNKLWLDYFSKLDEYKHLVKREHILESFTEIRQQTEIDALGVADEHSLRTIRVLRKGMIFWGAVQVNNQDEKILNTLLIACLNFRRLGTKRNRGFGEVCCSVFSEGGQKLSITQKLEALCTA